jgi:hypothetical protein
MNFKKCLIQHPYEWLSAILMFIYFYPAVFMIDQAVYLIHDNLDSNVVWYKRLAESGLMFKKGTLDFTMGGIPRDSYPSEWSVERLLYLFFNAQMAYTINYVLIHLLAFIGMRLFLKTYVTKNELIYNFVALAFGMLPFWVSGGLTVSGLPFLVYALLNIFKDKSNKWDWIIIIFFPFYSFFVFGNAFSFPLMFLFWLFGLIYKKWNFKFVHLLAFLILILLTIFVEKRFFSLLLIGFESNRLADLASVESYMNSKGILGSTILAFIFGHYHFHSLQVMIAFTSMTYVVYCLFTKKTNQVKELILLLITLAFFSFVLIFLDNYDLKSLLGNNFPRISFRLWVWFPFLWYVIFALVIEKMQKNGFRKLSKLIIVAQLLFVMFLIYPRDYFGSLYAENILANTVLYKKCDEQSNWKTYYRVAELEEIKNEIPDIVDFKVVRIGILPEVLQYNGLQTLEGYYSYYPIENFRMIKEIDTLERVKSNINHYEHTNRNYLYFFNENNSMPNWNWELLIKNEVKYIVSDKGLSGNGILNLVFDNELKVYEILR